ncbi:MAG: di-trans,poly-cis-decaprenylcistransferase [Actinobacteria bacterium]|nr:di-trans,poly-cis-decaprenylcistransferase [Actinomycetota bacterium]
MRIIEANEVDLVRRGEIPRHVGVIMDGNGRWAQMRGLSRSEGHAAAEAAVVATVDACLDLGVGWLSAYAFSTENWTRDPAEVSFLMRFDEWLLRKERRDELNDKGVQIRFLGRIDDARIPPDSHDWLYETMALTERNDRLVLAIAFNYGGRAEIVDAVNAVLGEAAAGASLPVDGAAADSARSRVSEADLAAHMYAPDMPDIDLLVRTSAEQRVSNYFPWHAVYAEFVFADTLWPDFREGHLYSAVAEYQQRRRRMGSASVG